MSDRFTDSWLFVIIMVALILYVSYAVPMTVMAKSCV